MKRTFLLFTLAVATGAHAQLYVANSNVWFTAQERARVEYRAYATTFNRGNDADEDLFLLNRARAGIGAKVCDWFKVYGELQDAREIDSKRSPNADEDTLDFHQGWFELANYKEFPVGIKLGRQELSYGDERLVGMSDWSNTGRVFDAVKLRWQHATCWVELFAANAVAIDDNSFDDHADWADDFYGVYGRTTALPNHVWDLYAFFRDKGDAVFAGAKRQNYTFGTRFAANEKLAPWDYTVEVIGQFGHIQTPGSQFGETNSAWASHTAFAATINAGHTWKHDWKPRLGIGYDYASGDRNPNDGQNETFDPLYPTGHKPLGYIDVVGWKNIHNPHVTFAFIPIKNLRLQLDGHLFWLAENQDAWYRANSAAVRRDATGSSDSFLGSEIDVTATYTPHKRVKLQAGYSHFFTGSFVEDTGNHSDADFVYTQATLSL